MHKNTTFMFLVLAPHCLYALTDAKDALIDLPSLAYSSLMQNTKNSKLNNVKTIYAVVKLLDAKEKVKQAKAKHTPLTDSLEEMTGPLAYTMNDNPSDDEREALRTLQTNMEILNHDLQTVDLENIINVLHKKDAAFLQLGRAEGSDRLDAEIKELGIGYMQDIVKMLKNKLDVVQRGGI